MADELTMPTPIVYPDELPTPQEAPIQSTERRVLSEGRPFLARNIQRDRGAFQSFMQNMTQAQVAVFSEWGENDIEHWGNWFLAPKWPRPEGAGGVRRWVVPPRLDYIDGLAIWRVSGLCEVRGRGVPPMRPNDSAYWLHNDYVDLGLNSSGLGDVPWIFSNGDRTVYVPDDAGGFGNHYQGSVYSNLPQGSLKRYFEIVVGNVEDGGSPNQFAYGFVSENQTQSGAATFLGTGESWCLAKDGAGQSRYVGNDGAGGTEIIGGLADIAFGSVLGFAIDIPNRKAWMSIDNVWLLSGDPGAGTNPIAGNMPGDIYNPAFAAQRGLVSATLRSVEEDFTGTIPSGFIEWADLGA